LCRLNLSDEDTNSILTDNANRAIQGYLAMQVTQPGGQLWNQAMQVTSPDDQILNQFATNEKIHTQKKYKSDFNTGRFKLVEPTNASGAIWWPNLQPMRLAPSGGLI
jgi:hypothetical protein